MNKKVVIQIVLAVAVFAAGLLVFMLFLFSRKAPDKKAQEPVVPLLNSRVVKTENVQVVIDGFGTVQPKVEVTVIPQVSGKIIDCHENLINGGFFKAGEPLIVIEPDDYELAVERADAAIKQAKVAYERELAEQKVALLEWDQIHPGEDPNSPLVTRELQVKFAEAEFKAAQAKLNEAKLNLERTVIKMPFDGRVASESVDIGQYIPAGQPVATVYSTDAVEIAVPLEDTQLEWFDVPGGYNNGSNSVEGEGAKAEVTAEFAGGLHCWPGQVVRTRGQIDPVSRMVYVVVEVDDPFKFSKSRPPLVPGMFVTIDIQGRMINKVIRVPRYAIRDGGEVWIEKEGELKIVKVEILRMDRENAYISDGLVDGDVVIVSPLDIVTNGMKIRTNILNPEKTELQEIKIK
ncbi:MAG: efflux RND transporter periplasmic adaptor subunit [Phycisphaerae bacterium]|nr:efflux RND transporter periplasmic adaptor subunit [Phycisphaerae bacterium]